MEPYNKVVESEDNNSEISNKQWEEYEKVDEIEKKLKNKLKKLYLRRIIEVDDLNSIIRSNSRSNKGLCGLQNLGNTCFMNSAIQCVSHSIELTYFFLSKSYESEINTKNKLGLKGKLAKVWYNLIYELWMDSSRSTAPSDFKSTISKIASQFSGFGQQDSHELLTFLLDGLHEDLNKICEKPYLEIAEKGLDEDDESAAQRFWDLHLQRNDSIIVDLFHGQYRSTITCPECQRVSITYDPYTTVPIPIPKLKKVDLYLVPQFNIKKTTKLSIFISEEALFYDIAHYINSNLEENQKINRFRCMIVSNNECQKLAIPSENIIECTNNGFIFCCEINPKLGEDYVNLIVHIRDSEDKSFKSYPRMFTITSRMNIRDLQVMIYGFIRRFIVLPESIIKKVENKYEIMLESSKDKKISYDEYESVIKEEFDLIWGTEGDEILKSKFPFVFYLEKGKKKVLVFKPDDLSSMMGELNINSENNLKNIIELYKAGYKLILELSNNSDLMNSEKLKSMQTCISIAVKEKTKSLNLNDCLDHFRLTERLGKNNEWFCIHCKKHQQAFKKLELFYTPKLLVLHLKRFEYSSSGRYRTYAEKIGLNIDFPLDNLNMSQYIIGPDSSNANYELYAVSQHYGSCGGGHYTAICKNNGKWYDCNDSTVSASNENSVVSSAAYLLFYRRKD